MISLYLAAGQRGRNSVVARHKARRVKMPVPKWLTNEVSRCHFEDPDVFGQDFFQNYPRVFFASGCSFENPDAVCRDQAGMNRTRGRNSVVV